MEFDKTNIITTHNRLVPSSSLGGATKFRKAQQVSTYYAFFVSDGFKCCYGYTVGI